MPDRAAWLNRPASERYLGLAEWTQERLGGTTPPANPQTPYPASRSRENHHQGEMNGLEKRYAQHLELRKQVGEIEDWRFEPIKLLLAPKTTFTGDFVVKVAGSLELHETKGWWEEDARLKIKWAAKDFGWMFSRVVGVKWAGSDWKFEEFSA